MEQRRILLLITDLERGGTPTVVRELAIRMRRAEPAADIQVACLAKWGPVADELRAAGVRVTALDAGGAGDVRILPRLVRLLKQERFDTVFSFLIHANAVAAAASLWVRDVRWIQAIQTAQPWPEWHWHVQRLAAKGIQAVVAPSLSVASAAMDWAKIPAEKIVIIPNAIDPADFTTSLAPQSHARPYPITFIGRLDPVKDVPTLIAAVARIRGLVHLHIYGNGSDRRRIEEEIARQKLNDDVTLHGVVDRPQEALAGSGMLVLPSLAEGFGLVLIEAMAAGVPVVATNVAGIRDVVRPEITGLLVPSSDPKELGRAIRRVIEDRQLRLSLIENGGADVRQRFSWEIVLGQYLKLLHLSEG